MKSRFSNYKVSVIIPNYNYANFVGAAINSVLTQTYKNFEIIVVNNGSIDNSLQVLHNFKDKIILVDQPNLGQSGARNSGLTRSSGELIAFLDADDLWEPEKLQKQIALFREDTQLIYSGLLRFDDHTGTTLSLELPVYKGICTSYFLEHPGVGVVLGGESTAIFTRELVAKVGEFDTHLNISAGWDFFRRCSAFTNFDFAPEILTRYRIHGGNMSSISKNNIFDIRNAFYKLVADDSITFKFRSIFISFIRLEWSFLKTYFNQHSVSQGISEVTGFPFHTAKLICCYRKKTYK